MYCSHTHKVSKIIEIFYITLKFNLFIKSIANQVLFIIVFRMQQFTIAYIVERIELIKLRYAKIIFNINTYSSHDNGKLTNLCCL